MIDPSRVESDNPMVEWYHGLEMLRYVGSRGRLKVGTILSLLSILSPHSENIATEVQPTPYVLGTNETVNRPLLFTTNENMGTSYWMSFCPSGNFKQIRID